MSRLATIVGALSAIVTLVDYLVARSFLSHWFQRQIKHTEGGWQISPTLNLVFIAALVAGVWLATETAAGDAEARKRLFRLRANIVIGLLVAWFFFGPSIGGSELAATSPQPTGVGHARMASEMPPPTTVGNPPGNPASLARPASQGHTSQFTWDQPGRAARGPSWKPGDGLRAMARVLEVATGSAASPDRATQSSQ